MKTVLRILLYLILLVVVIAVGFVSFIQVRGIPKYEVDKIEYPQVQSDSELVANGVKIASVQCIVCHRGSDGKLSGRLMGEVPQFGEIHSANITQSKEYGIGNWTDAEIAYLIRTGVRPNGQFIPPYMPKFPHMSDYDLKSIIAFLHSDKPEVQASEIPSVPSKPSFLNKFLCFVAFKKIPYPEETINIPDTTDMVELGKYLVCGRYDCFPCHSKDFKTMNIETPELSEGYMGGGNAIVAENGSTRLSANLTPDEETGIGTWTEEDFTRAMLEQKSKGGQTLRNPMLPYNGLTSIEVKAMWAYLRSIPAIKNEVERSWDKE